MDLERWQRIKALQFAASELHGDARERYLSANCATPEERSEVERMLQSAAPTNFMNTPVLGERPTAVELRAGDKFGRYQIQGLLGAGGGGKVYRALDPNLRRTVAIKVLQMAAVQESDRRRFRREAETASALNHPNIVTVYEIGVENGIDFIAMEFINGKSLRESIPKRGLKLSQFFPWAIQIAEALAAAHRAGIVHRDLKPGNVMITDRGTAKVVDFGIAKAIPKELVELAEANVTLTQEGVITGTYAYMAPEQTQGKPVDSRADIFSFGSLLYEMVSGQPAFSGSLLTVIAKVQEAEPAPLDTLAPEVPAGVTQLIVQCLRKEPADRWQSAADIGLMLNQLRNNWQTEKAEQRAQRPQARWLLPAMLGIAVLAAGGAYWYGRRPVPAGPEFRLVALTTDAGLSTAPSVSADGRMLAYASDRGGTDNLDIWVQQIGGHTPIRLTSDPADETDPSISADGTRVVYRSEKDGGGIYVMPALGGQSVLLAQGGRNPRFSPDGAWVAYWVGTERAQMLSGSAQAYIIPSTGGHPRPIDGLAASMYPVWSPDGKAILVVGRKTLDLKAEKFPDWWVVPAGGGTPKSTQVLAYIDTRYPALRITPLHVTFVPVDWNNERGVVFAAQLGDASNLWSIGIDPENAKPAREFQRLTSGTGSELHATFATTREENRMAFTNLSLRFDLWTLPLDDETGVVRGDLQRLTSDLSPTFYPSVSWDGSKVAFVRKGAVSSLCVRDMASGKEMTLLTSTSSYALPRLSGDGGWVTFGEYPATISRIAARGGTVTHLCERCGTPVYSSFNGAKVLIEPGDGPADVRQIDVATGKIATLMPTVPAGKQLYSADMTRDGKWIAFHASESANSQVFVARIDGDQAAPPSEWIPITGADAFYQGPRWSPKGGVLYFLSNRDGFRCIWARRVNPATKVPAGPLFAVLHLHHSRRSLQHLARFDDRISLAVAPGMLVTVAGELTGNIWMREKKLK